MKIAVIRNLQSPEWQSCKTISQNLLASYEELGKTHDVVFYDLPKDNNLLRTHELAKKVKEGKPDEVIWVEYKPSPNSFVNAFCNLCRDEEKPVFKFHIYGDFVLNIMEWAELKETLKKVRCQYLVASEKQKILLEKMILGSEDLIKVCPFPVNSKSFSFDSKLREEVRKDMGLQKDELLILYSGRLSYQKNIYHTLFAIRDFLKLSSQKVRFVMAGPMDDLGMPYVGRSGPLGAFYGQFLNAKEALSDYFEKGIFSNLGNVQQENLKGLYCAADILINLSTHNDEDYGMAPAEALCCGCPAILSNWGGFYSFNTLLPDHVGLVNLKKEKGRFLPSYSKTVKELLKFTQYSTDQRMLLAEEANQKVGIKAVSKIIESTQNDKPHFESYTDIFYKLVASFQSIPNGPFKSNNGQLNGLYFDIYSDYGGIENE